MFLLGVLSPERAVPPGVCGVLGSCAPSEACGVAGWLLGTSLLLWAVPLYGNKRDLEYSCRQLISEQEVSCSRRLGEFNECFFTGKQRKLLFKLLLVKTHLMLNRPWLCLTRDAALSYYNFIKVDL